MVTDKTAKGISTRNAALAKAKQDKQDEFYTQLDDIAAELINYKEHFENKTVFCNCDDPYESNFFKYFALKFNEFKLKKLICTCWDGSPIAGTELFPFDDEAAADNMTESGSKIAYKLELTREDELDGENAINLNNVRLFLEKHRPQPLKGCGDFRSEECIELLKEADIVVTNPPFSLFREYVAQLMTHDKKFIIIGNKNAITYKEIFPLIKDNKIWTGYRGFAGGMWFKSSYEGKTEKIVNGEKLINVPAIWFTNLDNLKRHYPLDLYKHYNSDEYPTYDNYNAINVDKTADIPMDYDGVMGVPVSFLDKYCPEQFEILGITSGRDEFDKMAWPTKRYINPLQINRNGTTTNGSKANTRATLLLDRIPYDTIYYTADNAEKPFEIVYARLLIRRKSK